MVVGTIFGIDWSTVEWLGKLAELFGWKMELAQFGNLWVIFSRELLYKIN
jgi:hypothetical protein